MTTTFVGALRSTGLVAPLVVNGAITGDIFRADIEPQLVTVLRPGDIVVMDNLSSHKVAGGRDALRAVGAEVSYVPPDSPELNPIGMLVSNVKGEIRKRQPRTKTGCDELCGECPDWFTPTNATTTSATPGTSRKGENQNVLALASAQRTLTEDV